MKACDVCGTLNFKENNYCIHCGNKLILDDKFVKIISINLEILQYFFS